MTIPTEGGVTLNEYMVITIDQSFTGCIYKYGCMEWAGGQTGSQIGHSASWSFMMMV